MNHLIDPQRGLLDMHFPDPFLIALGLSGILYILLTFAVVRSRDIHQRATQLLAVYALVSLGWAVVEAIIRAQRIGLTSAFDVYALQRISLYILLALSAIYFRLTRLFERKPAHSGLGWVAAAFILAAALILYENPLGLPARIPVTPGMLLLREPAAFVILTAGWVVFMGGAITLAWRNYRSKTSPLHRNRNLFWAAAGFLAATGQLLFLFRWVLPGLLLHTAAVAIGCFAMLTHSLPDLRSVARNSTSYLSVTLLAVALYTTGFILIQIFAQRIPGFQPIIWGAALAVVMAALVIPLLGILQRLINRTMRGSHYDTHRMLSEYSQTISNIIDLDYLSAVAISRICDAMDISRGALITVYFDPGAGVFIDDSGGEYVLRPVDETGRPLQEGRLAGICSLVGAFNRDHFPITQYDIDLLQRFQDLTAAERAWFDSLGMDVYVPVYSNEQWIGMLAVGPKKSGDRYFNEDLSTLQTLADQTTIALENARLYDNLKQRNAENERLNQELRSANIELARLDEAKSDFINIASHELRTPLTQVIGYNDILSEMLKANSLDHQTGLTMVESVRKAARRLEEIVEMMFDVSKLESRTLDLQCSPISPASIITVALDLWMKGVDDRKQTVVVRGLANLPPVMADGKRMTQVFSNLVQNAIKSTPDGGQIRITGRTLTPEESSQPAWISPQDQPAAPQWVEIVVSDTGIGIAAEDLERIFIKFFRVGNVLLHSSGDTKFKGAGPGLGLTIARGIVEAHGGRMWAESAGYDEACCPGASFHVVLPVANH